MTPHPSDDTNHPDNTRTKIDIVDFAIRLILGAAFAVQGTLYLKSALIELQTHLGDTDPTLLIVRSLSILAISLYTLMIAFLYTVRRRAVTKFAGFAPSLAALFGGFLLFALLLFTPRTDLSLSVQIASCALVMIGNIFAVICLLKLGRSFSILPEGRALVTAGPYRYIRHPLYLAEAIAIIGALISFWSPGAIALIAVQFVFQFMRMNYEERVLRDAFPEYNGYAKRTARLIPGIY
jgi:hypothetical protein